MILGAFLGVVGSVLLFVAGKFPTGAEKNAMKMGGVGFIVAGLVTVALNCYTTVPAGHIKVATLFGKVQDQTYAEGFHVVNPLLSFTKFDLRQKTHKETAGIPAEDKLITQMDVSVQYRTVGALTPDILRNTGTTDALIQVHMIPKLRSVLREQGKGVPISQDFFKETIQQRLQLTLQESLATFLAPKGIEVESVLIRNVVLPAVIRDSITETKKREQEVLKQEAELMRFATEQNQKVKQAESEYEAAKLEAQKIKALADAEAYKIDKINKTLARSPNYIELKKVEQWNGVLPVYTGGGGSIPMIDLRK